MLCMILPKEILWVSELQSITVYLVLELKIRKKTTRKSMMRSICSIKKDRVSLKTVGKCVK